MCNRRSSVVCAAAAAVIMALATGRALSAAPSLPTRDEALALAYPSATITAEQLFLTEEQRTQVAAAAGTSPPAGLVARYIARSGKRVVGRAYADTHVVRTKKETLLICLDASGRVKRVDTIVFLEPPEYQAPEPFVDQYKGKTLSADLRLQRAIRPIAGATLTARAMTEAVRRVLALDAVVR